MSKRLESGEREKVQYENVPGTVELELLLTTNELPYSQSDGLLPYGASPVHYPPLELGGGSLLWSWGDGELLWRLLVVGAFAV